MSRPNLAPLAALLCARCRDLEHFALPKLGLGCLGWLLSFLWFASATSTSGQARFWSEASALNGAPPTLITNLAQLRGLEESIAVMKIPVRLQATVTYCEDQWPTLFVQDGDSPAYIYRPKGTISLAAGDRVEIEGYSGAGFSPLVDATAIRKIGTAELPPPVVTTLKDLGTGRYDGLRVRVTTTVRWMHVTYQRLYLYIGEGNGRYEVHIPTHTGPLPTNFLGAVVELTGITGTKLNSQGYLVGAGLSVPSVEDVRVITPTPEHPWERSTQTIGTLMRFHRSTSFGQRTKVAGVVTLNTPSGKLYVQDASGGCEVRMPLYDRPDGWGKYLEAPQPPDLKVGDQVEVLGYPDIGSYAPILTDAMVRRTGTTNLMPPDVVTGTNVLTVRPDAKRIRLEGRVVASQVRSGPTGLQQRLTINSDNVVFFAEFEGTNALSSPVESQIAVTGICSIDTDDALRVTGFRVLIPRPEDVDVLVEPPLISTQGLARIGAALAAIVVAWIWMLRGQVRRRTLQLGSKNEELRREVSQRIQAEHLLEERVRVMSLNADVALALNESAQLQPMLQRCTELLVQHLGAAFARAWTLNDATQTLELQASAGLYTHLDGPHSRVPVGQFKIGLIALEKKPHLTNDVLTDIRVSDKDWARREGLVAFAGYPLLLEGRLLGVLAIFSRQPLGEEVLQSLGSVAHSIALGIQRLRSQSALAESEAHLRTITDHNPAAIIVLDADQGRFIEANGTAERMTGYSREELFHRGPLETSPPFQPDGRPTGDVAKELIEKVLTTGHATFEWISRSASGVDFPTETRAARIPIHGRNLIVASMVDITARKEVEAELTRALAREKELSELKSNFVSMVSHEFRTPLEIIISSADNLQRYHDRLPPEKRQQLLQSIHKAVLRMSGMMEEVLVLGRLETDRMTFSPAPLELGSFCQRLCDEIESATNQRCLIALRLDGLMDGASGDEGLLRHIFTNLLSNAVKYSPTGQGVEFHVQRQGDQAICRVIDHGCGIPETDQKMLFQAFHRGSNVGRVPGTGLGLLIVRRCVELHGGDIQFASTEGQGATFTVRLPLFAPLPTPSEPAAIEAIS